MRDKLEILLIEDDPKDVEITREALKMHNAHARLKVIHNGQAALDFLRESDDGLNRPDLILLDLGLPGLDGREVLAKIKEDPGLSSIPVIVISKSESEEDITYSYQNGASCFIPKTTEAKQFSSAMEAMNAFWLGYAKLPSRKNFT